MDKSSISKNSKIRFWLLVTAAICVILIYIDNTRISVSEYEYYDTRITNDNYKIVQLSDFHNAHLGLSYKALINKIKKLDPDIIVVTGDMVDSNHTDVEGALKFAKDLTDITTTYYVTGNHEYWLYNKDLDCLFDGLRSAGVNIMLNEAVTINADGYDFSLIGLDDRNLTDNTLSELTDGTGTNLKVLLAHEPDYFDKYVYAGVDLILAGHVHGGQFRFPVIGGLLSPEHGFFPEYDAGSFEKGQATMIVNRGIGNSVIRVRLFNNPEIVCVTLKGKRL